MCSLALTWSYLSTIRVDELLLLFTGYLPGRSLEKEENFLKTGRFHRRWTISRRSSRPCQWLGLRVENPEDSLPRPSRSILFRQKATITQTDRRLLSSQTRTGRDSTD